MYMAGDAVGCTLVVEDSTSPRVRVMAQRTLSGEMVWRAVLLVAGLAVCQPLVGECGTLPGGSAVASRALPGEMVDRFILVVARLAVYSPGGLVVEAAGRLPGACVVAA